jgi:hypothetical protein
MLPVLLHARPHVAAFVARAAAAAPADLPAHFAAAARAVGRAPLVLTDAERSPAADAARSVATDAARSPAAAAVPATLPWPPCATEAALARIALLVSADVDPATAAALYRTGDNDERAAILRALPLLPEPARFVPLAVDACRTHVLSIFEAIACENPFPASYFPPLHFDQMALKAVFLGVALARVVGLAGRRTPELARMAEDYAAERRAAGRAVPADLTLLGSRS